MYVHRTYTTDTFALIQQCAIQTNSSQPNGLSPFFICICIYGMYLQFIYCTDVIQIDVYSVRASNIQAHFNLYIYKADTARRKLVASLRFGQPTKRPIFHLQSIYNMCSVDTYTLNPLRLRERSLFQSSIENIKVRRRCLYVCI